MTEQPGMDDRPSLFDDQPALSENLADDVVAYRPVSPLAVLGAVVGLASPLALVSGFLAPVPIVGALVSFAAALGIRRDPEAKSGLGVAVFGLVLSLVMLGAVWVRVPLAQRLHLAAMEPVVERFFEKLREGNYVAAHQLTRPFPERLPDEESARLYYEANAEAQVALLAFQDKPEIVLLSGSRPELIERSSAMKTGPGVIMTTWRYRLPPGEGEPDLDVTLRMERRKASGFAAWRIAATDVARASD